jgi:sulfur carrier protein ThiS
LRSQLADFSNFVRANAERSNTFWWRQRSGAIAPARSFTRWAMAGAAVIIAAAASLPFIQQHTAPPARVVVRPAQMQQQVSDEALLGEVQSDVLREYPDALAPVGTNAETAVAATQMKSVHKKEHKQK